MSEIDKKTKKGTLLVWITNPAAADRIVSRANQFADEKALVLKVVSVQKETRDNWGDTLRDLERLEAAATMCHAELTVVYSDDRFEAAKKLIRSERPVAMFAGVPDNGAANRFADTLFEEFPSVVLYCVDSKGEVKEYGRNN